MPTPPLLGLWPRPPPHPFNTIAQRPPPTLPSPWIHLGHCSEKGPLVEVPKTLLRVLYVKHC